VQQFDRATISLGDIASVHAFPANETRPELFTEQSKRVIGVFFHGRKRDCMGDGDISDLHD
jgi:hypothetical protein